MTDPAALPCGGGDRSAAPSGLPKELFPAARLAPARWLGDGEDAPDEDEEADKARTGIWHPASPFRGAGDIFAPGYEGAGAAMAIALAEGSPRTSPARDNAMVDTPSTDPLAEVSDERCFLWVQDRAALRLGGRPYLPGLPRDLRHRLVHVCARDAGEALFALEEGIRCRDLAFVIGEVAGNPKEMDFTASRRLVLAAERHGVPLWLVRLDARRDLGAARMRWDVCSAPSAPSQWNAQAPGNPRWQAELFRARGLRPGTWWLTREEDADGRNRNGGVRITAASRSDPATGAGDLAGPAGDRSLAAAAPRT